MSKTLTSDVEQRAQSALASSPIYVLRDLRIEQPNEESLLISGRVDTFYHKQLAQEVVRAVADGYLLINDIDVDEQLA